MSERNDDSSPSSCSTCRFYYLKTEQVHHAWIETRPCRRFPQHVGHYPSDWCGEYSPSTGLTGRRNRHDDDV